jgi:O-antigen ligase
LVVTIVPLVGTYSRVGWAIFLIGAALFYRPRPRTLLAIAIFTIVVVAAVAPVRERVFPSESPTTASPTMANASSNFGTYESYQWRLDTWRELLNKYGQSPLVGYGLRSTPHVNPRVLALPGQPVVGYEAHNSVIKLLVEGGPILLIAWALLLFALIRGLQEMAGVEWPLRRFARLMIMLWGALIIAGILTDDPLDATALLFLMFALTGALDGTWQKYVKAQRAAIATRDPLDARSGA